LPELTAPDGVRLHYEIEDEGPDATRIRLVDLEHLNAFLDSGQVLPHVTEFLGRHAGR